MESRKHEVLRVYSIKSDFSDLLFVGKLSAKFKNGKEASDEFIVRLVFHGDTSVKPIGKLYQIWAVRCYPTPNVIIITDACQDSAPWVKAMQ